MLLSPDEMTLLSLANEDDFGLWEAVWEFRRLSPKSSDTELDRRAESALRGLLDKGLIALWRGVNFQGEEKQLTPDEASSALKNLSSWDTPASDESERICFTTTEFGDDFYLNDPGVRAFFEKQYHERRAVDKGQ